LLRRNIESIANLRTALGHEIALSHIVVHPSSINLGLASSLDVQTTAYPEALSKDSRWTAIQTALKGIDTDYVWFVDDDDWIQVSTKVDLVGLVAGKIDRPIFLPGILESTSMALRIVSLLFGGATTYRPGLFFLSQSSVFNLTPFPCVIYPKRLLLEGISSLQHWNPVFREDQMIFLASEVLSHQPLIAKGFSARIYPGSASTADRRKSIDPEGRKRAARAIAGIIKSRGGREISPFRPDALLNRYRLGVTSTIFALERAMHQKKNKSMRP